MSTALKLFYETDLGKRSKKIKIQNNGSLKNTSYCGIMETRALKEIR